MGKDLNVKIRGQEMVCAFSVNGNQLCSNCGVAHQRYAQKAKRYI